MGGSASCSVTYSTGRRRSFRLLPALPGPQHPEGSRENILGFRLRQVRRAVIVLNRPGWCTPSLCRGGTVTSASLVSQS